ncbi:MAG: hypothetical protein QXX51_02675 [Candidatus Bathyarchaeia archaeon]
MGNTKNGVIRIRTWKEFREIADKTGASVVVYNIEQNAFSENKELTCLRLILPCEGVQYVFLDFPKGDKLRETGITIRKDRHGNRYLHDEDIIGFLKREIGKENLQICSYWTI